MKDITTANWGSICVKLLQGPLYRTGANDINWNTLTTWISDINEYFSKIGLTVIINQSDGFAFLAQNDDTEESSDDEERLPRLIKKAPLTVELSLLCVLLREALDQFDNSQSESSMLVLKESEIKDLMSPYMKDMSDQTRLYKKLDDYISQLIKLSFIREIGTTADTASLVQDREFEIRRIIRTKISPEFLQEFKKRLEALNEPISEDTDE